MADDSAPRLRVDKWLWQARFFRTRSLATKVVVAGSVRVNSTKISKASYLVQPDDVLTFTQSRQVRVIRVLGIGERRGPAPEAQALYEDLSPPAENAPRAEAHPASDRAGRPTKKQRRDLDAARRTGS